MEILRGFGSQISDRDAQSPRTSRDIVLCHPQALQEGAESIVGIETENIAAHSVELQAVRYVLEKSLPEPATELLGYR